MNIKRNIIFALESRKKDGVPITQNVPIRMRVIFASQRIEFTTGYRIDIEKWDANKQRVRNGCTNKLKQSASEINAELLRQYTEIQNVFKEFEVQDITPNNNRCKADTHFRLSAQFGVQPRKTTGRQPLVQVAFQTGERTVFQGEHGTEPLVRFWRRQGRQYHRTGAGTLRFR